MTIIAHDNHASPEPRENGSDGQTWTTGAEGETIGRHSFIEGVELYTVTWVDGRTAATLVQTIDREVTPADLRVLADQYEAFPEWLRARAEEIGR